MKKLLIGKVYLYTQVQRQRNERDPNKNNKGKIMEGKILMRGKNTQYISEEIDVSYLDVKSVKNHWSRTKRIIVSPFFVKIIR